MQQTHTARQNLQTNTAGVDTGRVLVGVSFGLARAYSPLDELVSGSRSGFLLKPERVEYTRERMAHFKGTVFDSTRMFVEQTFGAEGAERVLQELSRDDQDVLRAVT